jgi:transposase-like protein
VVITRLTGTWDAGQRAVAQRDLSGVDYVYLWADGIHVNIHLEEQKITDDLDESIACCGYPAGHWVHLRTASPIGPAFATVRHRTKATEGPGHASSAVS